MKKIWVILFVILNCGSSGFSQVAKSTETRIIFNGIIKDASSLVPLANSQIIVNRSFVSASAEDGTFAIRVNRRDTVVFNLLGYKSAFFYVSDTLSGHEFIAGVYLKTDTLSIGEVIILPKIPNLKSDILRMPSSTSPEMENAKYNMAVSAYQGKVALSKLGDPSSNYSVIQQKQRIDAYEKGGIPSDKMLPLNPLLLIPAAYLLIHGFPEHEPPLKSDLSRQELDQIHKRYLETLQMKK